MTEALAERNLMKFNWKTIPYAIKAISSKVGRLVTGQSLRVEADTWKQRLRTCSICKFNHWPQCSVCTCFIDNKVKWVDEYCPLMKWGEPMTWRDWLNVLIGLVIIGAAIIGIGKML